MRLKEKVTNSRLDIVTMDNSTLTSAIIKDAGKNIPSSDHVSITRPSHLNVILYDQQLLLRHSLISVLQELSEKVQITDTATLNETLDV